MKAKPRRKDWPRRTETTIRPDVTEVTTDDGMFRDTMKVLDLAFMEAEGAKCTVGPAPPPWGDPREKVPRLIAALREHFTTILQEDVKHPKSVFPGTEQDRPSWRGNAESMLGCLNLLERELARGEAHSAAFVAYCLGREFCRWNCRALFLEQMRKRRNSAECLQRRTEGPAWRAVRLADSKRPRRRANELQDIWEKVTGHPVRSQDSFNAQLSRRRKAWRRKKS